MVDVMKRDNAFNYGHALRCQSIIDGAVDPVVIPSSVLDRHDPAESFLSIVYALDPLTHLPTGDLQYLVSDKANPEVKHWVLENIMIDVSSAALPAAPRGLSDDDIAALTRRSDESVAAYMDRVNEFAQVNRYAYERLVSAAQQGNGEKEESVSPGSSVSSVSSE